MDDNSTYNLEDSSFSMYSPDMDKKIKKIIEEEKYDLLTPYTKSLNYMSRLITHFSLINPMYTLPILPMYGQFDTEEFLTKFEDVFSKFNNPIAAETMLKIFNNVRKVEYYQNPEWYPYSFGDMYKTFISSNWEFKDKHLDTRSKILQVIFQEEVTVDKVDNFRNYGQESGLFKEIEQVRLAKVLKLVHDKKKNN